MSEHEVPLEEVNEHISHHAQESKEKWISMVALSTAFLAAFAAVSALCSSHFESESMKEHNEEFNQWSYYQAKGIEKILLQSRIATLIALKAAPDPKDDEKIKEYDKKRDDATKKAEHLHAESEMHGKAQENFALGVTMFQMAIAIGAISVLTKRRGFWYVSMFFGAVGIFFLISGFRSLSPSEEHGEKPAAHEKKGE